MKKTISFLLVFIFVNTSVKSQTFTDPTEYLSFMVDQHHRITEKIADLINLMGDTSSTKLIADKTLAAILKVVDSVNTEIEAVDPYEGSLELKMACTNFCSFYASCFSNEYPKILAILYTEKPSKAEDEELKSLLKRVTEEEKIYNTNLQTAKENFSNKYKIEIQEQNVELKKK